MDLYAILGVSKNATHAVIQRNFRKRSKLCHPDVAPEKREEWEQLLLARNVLTNVKARARYDSTGEYEEVRDYREQAALTILSRISFDLLTMDTELTTRDVKGAAIGHIQDLIEGLYNQLEALRKAEERAKSLQGRWTVRSSKDASQNSNIMDNMLHVQVQQLQQSRLGVLQQVEAHKRAIEILGNHDFRYDIEQQMVVFQAKFKSGSTYRPT